MVSHSTPLEELITSLSTSPTDGLTAAQAEEALSRHGENKLREGKKKTNLQRFFDQFKDAMILILIAAAVVSFVVACSSGEPSEFFEPLLIVLIVVLNAVMGVHGNRIPRVTTAAFELALPVVFHSPIQHLGIVPENLSEFPNFVWDYLRDVPTVWDETRCLSGYPGRDAVLARRKGGTWYVAGINGENCDNKQFDLVLPTLGRAELIRDKAWNRNAVERLQVDIPADGRISFSVPAYGGFVLVIR